MDLRSTDKGKTIKLSEENMKANLHDFGLGNSFLVMTRKTYVTKEKMDVGLHQN